MGETISDGREPFREGRGVDYQDVRILEGFSILGTKNLALAAKHLGIPATSLRYRIMRMMEESNTSFHMNPYHSHLSLKKAVIFVKAVQGYEDILRDCLQVNDFWVYLCRINSPYEGWGGVWTVPADNVGDFNVFLQRLIELGVAESVETNWTTDHVSIPVRGRWFCEEENRWVFDWNEWMTEVEKIKGELPCTLRDHQEYTMNFDNEDLLIIKELELDGRATMTEIGRTIGIPFETVKYHYREHVKKRDLVEGYQIEILRHPPLSSEALFIKFAFDSHEKLVKFALSLQDAPFPIFISKVIGDNALVIQFRFHREDFREFRKALSTLVRMGLLQKYECWIQDIYDFTRRTLPYTYFENNSWNYDVDKQMTELAGIVEKSGFVRPIP